MYNDDNKLIEVIYKQVNNNISRKKSINSRTCDLEEKRLILLLFQNIAIHRNAKLIPDTEYNSIPTASFDLKFDFVFEDGRIERYLIEIKTRPHKLGKYPDEMFEKDKLRKMDYYNRQGYITYAAAVSKVDGEYILWDSSKLVEGVDYEYRWVEQEPYTAEDLKEKDTHKNVVNYTNFFYKPFLKYDSKAIYIEGNLQFDTTNEFFEHLSN